MTVVEGEAFIASMRRRVRLVILLDSADRAGMVPLKLSRLHAFAYLCNVLSPVWDMPSFDGKVLKRKGGPYYPDLQRDLDCLVGLGVALITELGHAKDADNNWRLEGSYALNQKFAAPILRTISSYSEEVRISVFIRELAFALSAIDGPTLDAAVSEDATYADPTITYGNVVDFDEWKKDNYSADVADYFERITPSGKNTTAAEKIHLYVRHLYRRAHNAS
jgi:hypothetical protein